MAIPDEAEDTRGRDAESMGDLVRFHELLTLTRPLHVIDVETTGLNVETDRIVEIGFQTWTAQGLKHEWRSYVNPGIPILNIADHHVTDDDVTLKCWKCQRYLEEHRQYPGNVALNPLEDCVEWRAVPKFAQIAERLAAGFSDCDFAGKNVRFDLGIMLAEMKRAFVKWSFIGAAVIDADRLEAIGEPRRLADLYKKHLGREMTDAHHALEDVRATTDVLQIQLQKYKQVLSNDVRLLHELQWPGWITSGGEFRFDREGIARCHFGKHRYTAMRYIPGGYWDWILRSDFPDDVRALAMDALKGKFPTRAS